MPERPEEHESASPPRDDDDGGGASASESPGREREYERRAADGAGPDPVESGSATDGVEAEETEEEFEGLDLPRARQASIGAAPGIEVHELSRLPSTSEPVYISCFDYSPDQVKYQEVDDVEDFILHHRPEWSAVRWINIDGLTDMDVIRAMAEKYELHPLAIEALLHRPQRPKVDSYPAADGRRARLFIIVRMLELHENKLEDDQISIFVGHKTIITFQETRGDVWDPIRQRIKTRGSRIRGNDASFLVYALLDAIVDHCFPILEHYGDRLEEIEDLVLQSPSTETIHEIHSLKRELLLLRRVVWPMREVVNNLQREPHECFTDVTRTYMRDVYDHTVQTIDIIETYREVASGLTETYMQAMGMKMNEIIKVLTVFATIFTPATFLASVYGMNFKHFPELDHRWAYPGFWLICICSWIAMIVWFKRRHWL